MKVFGLLTVMLLAASGSALSQEWRDSLDYAREMYKGGHYDRALKYYRSAQKMAPEGVDLSEEEGQSAYRARKYQDAEKAFNRATYQKDPKRKSVAYNNLGSTKMKQRDYKAAEESFKDALRQDPTNEKARQNLAEAKRERKEEECKKPNPDNPKDGDQQQPPPKPGQDEQNPSGKPKEGQQGQKPQNGQPQKPENGDGKGKPKQENGQGKLADKQTDRKLDELMRQEMDTKKRLDGSKVSSDGKTAKKDW